MRFIHLHLDILTFDSCTNARNASVQLLTFIRNNAFQLSSHAPQ